MVKPDNKYYLGIDVGGTMADGVLLGDDFKVIRQAKVKTKPQVLESFLEVLHILITDVPPQNIARLAVSSTLALNSLLSGQQEKTAILAVGGPGLPVPQFKLWPYLKILSASQNHSGEILQKLDEKEALAALKEFADLGFKALVIISKFGPKNSFFEKRLAQLAENFNFEIIVLASELCDSLNFARRLHTAALNASIKRLYIDFLENLAEAAKQLGLICPLNILKADGSLMTLTEARQKPVLALASGPAASLFGLWSLCEPQNKQDILMIDMGGTSTDFCLLAQGQPVLAEKGLNALGSGTLLPALYSHSLALGGDSVILADGDIITIGPERRGEALSLTPSDLGYRPPTFTDALNVLGLAQLGDVTVSRQAFAPLGGEACAQKVLSLALAKIKSEAQIFLQKLDERPIYTIGALLLKRPLNIDKLAFLGGPAPSLAASLAQEFALPVMVPPDGHLAGSLGAALARRGVSLKLFADTSLKLMTVPAVGFSKIIDDTYSLSTAKSDLAQIITDLHPGQKIIFNQEESFNRLSQGRRAARLIRLTAQTEPGLSI